MTDPPLSSFGVPWEHTVPFKSPVVGTVIRTFPYESDAVTCSITTLSFIMPPNVICVIEVFLERLIRSSRRRVPPQRAAL